MEAYTFLRRSVHEGGKVVSPTHRPRLTSSRYSFYSNLLLAQPSPTITTRIEPATFRLVAQSHVIIFLLLMIFVMVAFLTLLERNVSAYIHIRKSPNRVGFVGILQPFSDAINL